MKKFAFVLIGLSVVALAALLWAAEGRQSGNQGAVSGVGSPGSSIARQSNVPEQVRSAAERQLNETWSEIQQLKQADQDISEELYNRYFASERILFPDRLSEERDRPGGLDQGQDACPGLTIPYTSPMNFVDYGQTYWTNNDCRRPNCRDGKDVVYRLDVATEDFLTISTCGSMFDTWLCIYQDACCTGTPFLSNDDNEDVCGYLTIRAAIQACFQPGTYYIVLDGFSRAAYGHYQLLITSPGNCIPPNPEFECPESYRRHIEGGPDDEVCGEENMEVFCGDDICGEVLEDGDVDVFYFNVTECSNWTLAAYANDTPGQPAFNFELNPYLYLYNNNCERVIASNEDANGAGGVSGQDSRILTACLRPGLYWLELSGEASTTGPYILSVDCSPCPPALPLVITQTTCGSNICLSWAAGPPGTTYYIWRRIGAGPWLSRGTRTTNSFTEPNPGGFPCYIVFDSPCGVPVGSCDR